MKVAKVFGALVLSCLMASAQSHTPAQAEALVKQAVAFAKQNGIDKLCQETNQATGKFHVASGGDLYIFVYDDQGTVKAIGFNTGALVGKNRIDAKDPDGKFFIREIVNIAKTKAKGWVDYKYPNPASNKIEKKTSYVESYEGLAVGCGIYKN